MTPFILAVIKSTSLGSEGCFDLIKMALDETTVEIAFKPAARIVSPDSTRSTIPSATPSAHAASTLPPTYLMLVLSFASFASPFVEPLCSASNLLKYCSARFVKEVTTFLPIKVLWLGQVALLGYLDLETAFAKVEIEDFNDTCRCCRRYTTFVLFDLVAASDSEVDATFANECGDVCSGEEDEREREVLDECDIEARVAVELDV